VHDFQYVAVEYAPGVDTASVPPVSLRIATYGLMHLARTFFVFGLGAPISWASVAPTATPTSSIDIRGEMIGVLEMTVTYQLLATVYNTSITSYINNAGVKIFKSSATQYLQISQLSLNTGSMFYMMLGMGINLFSYIVQLDNLATMSGDFMYFNCSVLNIFGGAVLDTSGSSRSGSPYYAGMGVGLSGTNGSGAGHGSMGGTGSASAGIAYDNFYTPTMFGSAGGAGSGGSGSRGGGSVRLHGLETFFLDGQITADAQPAANTNAGGGSGGSIFVDTDIFTGSVSGVMTATGGATLSGAGGGGSGGLISIYYTDAAFVGFTLTYGGASQTGVSGGPGATYMYQQINMFSNWSSLIIDNNNGPFAYFILAIPGQTNYEFDDVFLNRHASLCVANYTSIYQTLEAHTLFGDRTGLIRVFPNQTATLQVSPYLDTVSRTPVNLIVDFGGELVSATTTYIVGNSYGVSLTLDGRLTGVQNFYVLPLRNVIIGVHGHTSSYLLGPNQPGAFTFGLWEMGAASIITFTPPMGIVLNVGNLTMKYLVYVSAEYASLTATALIMDFNATIDVSGRGSTSMLLGTPSNKTLSGAGAGYSTVGGSGAFGQANNTGGPAYGTLFRPVLGGSVGGSRLVSGIATAGGRGGSYMRLMIGESLDQDGRLLANGASGPTGTGSGGGSGGAIYVTTQNWKGYGNVSVNGGDGAVCGPGCTTSNPVYTGQGGGGSGGRIAVLVGSLDEYVGSTAAFGGGNDNAAEHLNNPAVVRTFSVPGGFTGGGYYQPNNEYWTPQDPACGCSCSPYPACPWGCLCSASTTVISRYSATGTALGTFTLAVPHVLGIFGDLDTYYYTADGNSGTVSKWGPFPSVVKQWTSFPIGANVVSVTFDSTYVYALKGLSNTVYIINKGTGLEVRYITPFGVLVPRLTLVGGRTDFASQNFSSITVSDGKIYHAEGSNVYRYDLLLGTWDGVSFNTSSVISGTAFNGRDLCVSVFANPQTYTCYQIMNFNIFASEPAAALKYANRTGGDIGGPGTILIEDEYPGAGTTGPTWYTRLYLDGQNVIPPKPLYLNERNPRTIANGANETNNADYAFNFAMIINEAGLELTTDVSLRPSVSFDILLSDGTFDCHVRANQTWYVGYVPGATTLARQRVNYFIFLNGELRLVDHVDLSGSHPVVLDFSGLLTGGQYLRLRNERVAVIHPTAMNGILQNNQIINVPVNGTLSFSTLTLDYDSQWLYDNGMVMSVGDLVLHDGSQIAADSIKLIASTIFMEGNTYLNTAARGPVAGVGLGAGKTYNDTGMVVGEGAGHGGYGGGLNNATRAREAALGGFPYGSYTAPNVSGSGGGGVFGGRGGSTVNISVGSWFYLDGAIVNTGGIATGNNCGGGSGGAVYLDVLNFSVMASSTQPVALVLVAEVVVLEAALQFM
jgi:hypothetical protein